VRADHRQGSLAQVAASVGLVVVWLACALLIADLIKFVVWG